MELLRNLLEEVAQATVTIYEDRILPHLIHFACSTEPNQKQREKIVPFAKGEVLEIGFGSGLNLPYYRADDVTKIWGLEPSAGMRRKAEPAIARSALNIELIDLPGESIPLAANCVDTVLVTYSLCTIPDVVTALEGMRRVLKPNGRLLFCEHGIAPDDNVRRWQHRLNPAWRRIAGGCNMDRDILGLLTAGGFEVIAEQRMYIPGLKILSYNYWGAAKIAR